MLRLRFLLRYLLSIVLFASTPIAAIAAIPLRQQIDVTGYVIHADLDPTTGRLSATTTVTFTTLEDLTNVVFGMNNGLQITALTSADKSTLTPERNATDSTVRVGLAAPMPKGTSATWTFTYSGSPAADTSPVDGVNFVHVADPVSILLYPGRWFPISMPGLYTDRFTAEIHVTVPTGRSSSSTGRNPVSPAASSPENSFQRSPPPTRRTSMSSSPTPTRRKRTTSPKPSPKSSST